MCCKYFIRFSVCVSYTTVCNLNGGKTTETCGTSHLGIFHLDVLVAHQCHLSNGCRWRTQSGIFCTSIISMQLALLTTTELREQRKPLTRATLAIALDSDEGPRSSLCSALSWNRRRHSPHACCKQAGVNRFTPWSCTDWFNGWPLLMSDKRPCSTCDFHTSALACTCRVRGMYEIWHVACGIRIFRV